MFSADKSCAGAPAGGGGLLFLELFSSVSSGVCFPNASFPSCDLHCSPYLSPHTPSASCNTIIRNLRLKYNNNNLIGPPSPSSSSPPLPAWSLGHTTDYYNGTYLLEYYPEQKGTYDIDIFLLEQGGLRGEYYDNIWFLNNPALRRIDSNINFQWGTGPILPYSLNFVAIRWTGKIIAPLSELYIFYIQADDWARVWFDKTLIIDNWGTSASVNNETWSAVNMIGGYYHDIIIEYAQLRGSANIELRWASPSTPKRIIPSSAFYYKNSLNGWPQTGLIINAGDPPVAINSYAREKSPNNHYLKQSIAGTVSSFYVQAVDIFNNTQENFSSLANFSIGFFVGPASVGIVASTQLMDASHVIISYVANGLYEVNYTISITGQFLMNILLNDVPLPLSPYTITIHPSTTYTQSTFYTLPSSNPIAGFTYYFTVQARDIYFNNRSSSGDDIFISLFLLSYNTINPSLLLSSASSPSPYITGNAQYISNGLYRCSFTPTIAGVYNFTIFINDQIIHNSPQLITVAPGPPFYPAFTANGTGVSTAIVNTVSISLIELKDKFGNLVQNNSLSFTYKLIGFNGTTDYSSTFTAVSFINTSPSVYTFSYTPTRKGNYLLYIQLSNIPNSNIKGSPFSLTVSPGAVAATKSTIAPYTIYDSLTNALVLNTTNLLLQTKDIDDNNVDISVPLTSFNITLTCPSAASEVIGSVTYLATGQYLLSYIPLYASPSCLLYIQINGTDIVNSPFTVNVSPASPFGSNSILSGTGTSTAIAGSTAWFTVKAYDAMNNALLIGGAKFNATFTLLSSSITSRIRSPVSPLVASINDLGTGTYNISYLPIRAGQYSLSTPTTMTTASRTTVNCNMTFSFIIINYNINTIY